MKNSKVIDDILNKYTDNGRIKYASIGEHDSFKHRYNFYKEYLQRELPELSLEEIVKFNKLFHKFKDTVYSFNGFDIALTILEEELKNE